MSRMITTAFYQDRPEWSELIKENRLLFCRLSDGYEVRTERKCSTVILDRTLYIIESLMRYDKVIWIDADAVILHEIHEEHLPDELSMAHDIGGLNDGVCITVKADLPMWNIMYKMLPFYSDNPMQSQAVLRDMKTIHKIIPLDEWNARWVKEYAKIIHYAGVKNQFEMVKRACEGAKTRLLDGVNL